MVCDDLSWSRSQELIGKVKNGIFLLNLHLLMKLKPYHLETLYAYICHKVNFF
jgi:hypothetical protein